MLTHLPTWIVLAAVYFLGKASHAEFGGFLYWETLAVAALIMGASSLYTYMQDSTRFNPMRVWPVASAILFVVAYRILYQQSYAQVSYFGEATLAEPSAMVSALIAVLTLLMGYFINTAISKAFPRFSY
jgi:hypothetical protein